MRIGLLSPVVGRSLRKLCLLGCTFFTGFLWATSGFAAGTCGTVFQIDPKGTYLRTNKDSPDPPTRVSLSALGVQAGGLVNLQLQETGTFQPTTTQNGGMNTDTLLVGVFVDASGSFLSPGPLSTASSIVTPPTLMGSIPTDIPQDFFIPSTQPVIVQVPEGAVALLFTADDTYFADNSDPSGNFGVAICTVSPPPLCGKFYQVDPRGTYLVTNNDSPDPPTRVNLSALGVQAGQLIDLQFQETGTFQFTNGSLDTDILLIGVFVDASGHFLSPGPLSTAGSIVTPPTLMGSIPTDIPQDFFIPSGQPVTAQVPQGAVALLFSADDSYFGDNSDPLGDFGTVICPQGPVLSIDPGSVIITQAVNNFILPGQINVTLVQGKDAAIVVPLSVSSPNPNDQTPVTVVATMPDGTTATSSPIPMASIGPATGPIFTQVTMVPVSVNSSGSGNITLQVSASDAISGSASVPIMVKQTNPLGIVYVPFVDTNCTEASPPAGCVENLRNPAQHVSQSDAFIQDTYPVADGQVTSTTTSINSTTSSLPGSQGVDADILSVALTRTISNSSARNGVGIVPSNPSGSSSSGYFSYHYPGDNTHGATIGLSIGSQTSPIYQLPYALFPYASLVEEGWWPITAHEIAHTFGASDSSGSVISNSFNVQASTSIPSNIPGAPPVLDFMGASGTEPPFSFFQTVSNAWITSSTYGNIFSGDLTNLSDPHVLVLSGIISQSGTVTMNPTYFLSVGYATAYSALANGVVNSLSSTGAVLSQSNQMELTT